MKLNFQLSQLKIQHCCDPGRLILVGWLSMLKKYAAFPKNMIQCSRPCFLIWCWWSFVLTTQNCDRLQLMALSLYSCFQACLVFIIYTSFDTKSILISLYFKFIGRFSPRRHCIAFCPRARGMEKRIAGRRSNYNPVYKSEISRYIACYWHSCWHNICVPL